MLVAVCVGGLWTGPAAAYRPFNGTDAAIGLPPNDPHDDDDENEEDEEDDEEQEEPSVIREPDE